MAEKMTAQQAADYLGYHVNHVYRLLKDGGLKGEQFNRVWILSRQEVDRFKALQDEHGRVWQGQR